MMAALDAVAATNTSATPSAIVRIIVASLSIRLPAPLFAGSKIGGRQATISSDKDNDGAELAPVHQAEPTPVRCKMRMDDARLFEDVQRLMIPAFFVST